MPTQPCAITVAVDDLRPQRDTSSMPTPYPMIACHLKWPLSATQTDVHRHRLFNIAANVRFVALLTFPIAQQESSDKSVVIGAAAVGGIAGVYLFHELSVRTASWATAYP